MHRLFSGKVILYLLFLLVLDICFIPLFHFQLLRPVFLYLMIVYAAFAWHGRNGIEIGFAAGVLRDLASFQPFGIETAVLSLSAWMLVAITHQIDRNSFILRFAITFLFVLFVSTLNLVLPVFLASSRNFSWYSWSACWVMAFSSALVMPFFFHFTARWFQDHSSLRQYELFR